MIQVIPELVEVQGRRKVKVTIKDGDRVVDADLIDPFQAAQRRRAAQRLAERAGEPHAAERIEQALLQCVELMTDAKDEQDGPDAGDVLLAGPMRVVRPELVIADDVVAVSVPEVVIRDGQAVGRWRIYLRLPGSSKDEGGRMKDETEEGTSNIERRTSNVEGKASDRRECRPLAARLDVGENVDPLWVHPLPGAPSPSTPAGWSEASRKAWLDGADADPVDVFDRICAAMSEYLDVEESVVSGQLSVAKGDGRTTDDGQRTTDNGQQTPSPLIQTLALWTMLTYVYVAWDAVPYLFVTGPAGSGKTRVFELLSRLVFRPLSSSNLSAAALFRTLHDRGGTLLLDEAERLADAGDDVAELRSILLAGYRRGGRASRLESAGDSYQMTEFQVFGPKAIACINSLPGALASRCIPVAMFRSPPGSDKPRRRIDADPARWAALRDDLHRCALGPMGFAAAGELSNLADVCPLGGRQYELWQPLLALAAWLDCRRPTGRDPATFVHRRVLELAHKLCDAGGESLLPEEDFLLLWTLTEKAVRGEQPTCKTILDVARRADVDALRGVSARRVAEILKRYGLGSVRSNGKGVYRDVLDQLKRVEARYGVDLNTVGKENVQFLKGRFY